MVGFDLAPSCVCGGVCTDHRVDPLGVDLLSHLLCAAQQINTVPALQSEQKKKTVNKTLHSTTLVCKAHHISRGYFCVTKVELLN